MIYLIGSLRNPAIPQIAAQLRAARYEVFSDWYAAGERADDAWRDYEKGRGKKYVEALYDVAADHVFEFDYHWLKRCNAAILVCPAGKSSHLELGWMLGRGKRGYILLDNPDRWDVMTRFATGVFETVPALLKALRRVPKGLL